MKINPNELDSSSHYIEFNKAKKRNYFDIDKLLSVVGFVNKNGQ